ncbi:hypothetical protein [Streptomyces abikoensis]|uniref:hypothetical protein n=1 Tax=Streptomyces abikoensis TaxID=97398 RepID=UPI001677E0A1|nr:hypothetical protein [Streptomyces abikoensis]GGP56090.1 hypothetical protein GCM10010214_31660 [Streptomyces abikoensis]
MPTTDAYGQGVQIAALTDAPNMATAAFNLADPIVQRTIMRFASASARNATLTSPVEGMTTWLQDVNTLEIYDGSGWRQVFYGATAWSTYTPTWTATTTNPSLGNGTLVGSYLITGKICHVSIMLTIGSTTNKGSGAYRISLPVATANTSCPGVLGASFSRSGSPNHGPGDSPLFANANSTDDIWFPNITVTGDYDVWTESVPWSPAAGNVFRVYGTYQTA